MPSFSIMDRLRVGMYARILFRHQIKTALIGRDDQVLADNFLENLLVNRGVEMRIYTDPAEGERWLATLPSG